MYKPEIYVFNKHLNINEKFDNVKSATMYIQQLDENFNEDINKKGFYLATISSGEYAGKPLYIENRNLVLILGIKDIYKEIYKLEYLKLADNHYFIVFNRDKKNQKLFYVYPNKDKDDKKMNYIRKLKPYTRNSNNALYVNMFSKKWHLNKLFEAIDEKTK